MIAKFIALLKNVTIIRRFLIVFYLVGAVGILLPISTALFIKLTPIALLLSSGLLMMHHRTGFNTTTILVFFFIFIAGIVVELIGVQTGLIFGHYVYGNGLGLKVFDTPLLIGLNWLLLVYTTASIVQYYNLHKLLQIIVGASIMIVYDLVMEQVAPTMDMWSWLNNSVPFANFIAWWIIAAIFHTLIAVTNIKIKNPIATRVLYVQFLFFVVLYLFM